MAEIIDLKTGLGFPDHALLREVEEQQDFASLVINASMDAIVAFDRHFRYTIFNPAAEGFHGVRKEDVLGKCALEIFPYLNEPKIKSYLDRTLAGECSLTVVERIEPNGEEKFTQVSRTPLRDEFGEVVGGLVILRDVTAQRALERQLDQRPR